MKPAAWPSRSLHRATGAAQSGATALVPPITVSVPLALLRDVKKAVTHYERAVSLLPFHV